jgi:hypothetical protein
LDFGHCIRCHGTNQFDVFHGNLQVCTARPPCH